MDFSHIHQKLLAQARAKMPQHLEHLSWSRQQLKAHQEQALQHLLAHAKQATPYYKKQLAGIDPATFKLEDLAKIPLTTKQDTLDHWDDCVAHQVITRQAAEQHLQKLRDGKLSSPLYQDKYLLFATGGSSGVRGLFVWSVENFADFVCLVFRYQTLAEKNRAKKIKKVATFVAASWLHASLPLFSATIDPSVEVKNFPANVPLSSMLAEIEAYQPDHLIGYSSLLVELSQFACRGRLNIHPLRVSTNSELLDAEGRDSIFRAWQVLVNNMWGSVEAGMMGVEDDQHQGMWIADDYVLIETVDEHLRPVKNPEEVRKLIVTNLFNFTFPIIRYVIDDAVLIEARPECTYRLAKTIQGRVDDWFLYHGEIRIHPMTFRHVLGQYGDIREYQVRQTENGAEIYVVAEVTIDLDKISQQLVTELQRAGLRDAVVTLKQLDKLARHNETGKLKRFIALKA